MRSTAVRYAEFQSVGSYTSAGGEYLCPDNYQAGLFLPDAGEDFFCQLILMEEVMPLAKYF